jgi:hypothetical protein
MAGNSNDGKAGEIIRRQERAASKRGNWESHWEEIAKRVLPRQSDTFTTRGTNSSMQGEKKTDEMYDATAAFALERFASAFEGMLTPRNQKWHRLRASDPSLNRDPEVLRWFDDATNLLFQYRYAPKANYASQQHEAYMSLGAFGTGVVFIDKLSPTGLRYKTIHLAECYFEENHQGVIDCNYRRFKMTARQIAQRASESIPESLRWRLPEKAAKALEKEPDTEFEIIHFVGPREDKIVGRLDYRGMDYDACYVFVEGKEMLHEGGYTTFPYAISRYVTAPGETYGRSPAMMVLPNIKVLNEQKKTVLKQGHRIVDPVLLAHDDGVLDTFSLKPGAINYGSMTGDGKRLVDVLPTGNLAIAQEMMDAEKQIINDAFLITLFQIQLENNQRQTATEVIERAREKGALLAPTMGRQQSEALGPMIERELDVLAADGKLPPMPRALIEAEGEYSVLYDSPLSRSMRAEEAGGFMRWMEMGTLLANGTQTPEALDWIEADTAMPELAEILAVPPRWITLPDKVEEKRQGRSQQAAVATMIEGAPAVAGLVKAGAGKNA